MNTDNHISDSIFISYYTNEGNYPALAEKLILSLNKFNLKHEIKLRHPFTSWEEGVSYKPSFILERLIKHRKTVIWLDIDTEIWQYPSLLFEKHDFAIYNWFADNNHHLDERINYNPKSEKLLCAGGVQKYGYTAPAIELLLQWISLTNKLRVKKNNDPILDEAFNSFNPPVKPLWLPKTYNRMDKHTHHWSSIDTSQVVINHDYVGGKHRATTKL